MAAEERRSFGALLKRYRLAAGLTHEELAERATLSPRAISDLERGVSRTPRASTLALLAGALGLSAEQRTSFQAAARSRGAVDRVLPGAARHLSALPLPLTAFVGRERERGMIDALLRRRETRLVTLTGAGGVGKTRLAAQVAVAVGGEFADGVCAVALASAVDTDGVVQTIGRALGLPNVASSLSVQHLIDQLADRDTLLLLDNFEHVLPAAPLVAAIVRSCPRLKVLATSRARLRLSGEREFPVAPLPVPDPVSLPTADLLAGYAAIALFVDRAQQVLPAFALTAENAPVVAAICARLDGLPLAIELAAARLKVLSPRSLLARLEAPAQHAALRLLAGGPHDAPARQRTLHDTIAWSYDLLDADEQRLLRALAVFAGGCTLPAVEVVCFGGPGPGPVPDALDGLSSLVDKSLLYREEGPGDEPRFMLLETIRAFALAQLIARGEEAVIRARHARYYRALVEANGALLFATARQRQRLAAEQENIQAALRWLVEHG